MNWAFAGMTGYTVQLSAINDKSIVIPAQAGIHLQMMRE